MTEKWRLNARRLASLLIVVISTAPLVLPSVSAAEGPDPGMRAVHEEGITIPVGPGADFTLLSKATTDDRFKIETSGPSAIEFAQVSIAPGGTTGRTVRDGIVVASIVQGAATVALAEAGRCTTRTINTGSALIQPAASVGEIRNEGSQTLMLYLTSLTPTAVTAPAPTPPLPNCSGATPRGVVVKLLNRSPMSAPFSAQQLNGSSDVYVGFIRTAPGATAPGVIPGGWHSHPGPVFVGVDQGEVTVTVGHGDQCSVTVFPARTGGLEMADMTHQAKNNTNAMTSFYILGVVPSPQPFLAFSQAPQECG